MLANRTCLLAFAWMLCLGCALPPPAAEVSNPAIVFPQNHEQAWETTVSVLHAFHFSLARENKLDGVIETEYLVGSGLLEPWHQDSVGPDSRLESSLQSIRRKAFVSLQPSENGYLVNVEVHKEREDVIGMAANSPGGATFQENTPLVRDLDGVVGQTAPSGWIPIGRDPALEQAILAQICAAVQ